jgi:hypothetical protein
VEEPRAPREDAMNPSPNSGASVLPFPLAGEGGLEVFPQSELVEGVDFPPTRRDALTSTDRR